MRWTMVICVAALVAGPAVAQVGSLTVTVLDVDSAPLPGATVTIGHPLGYVKTTAELTDARGVVSFPVLRAGQGYTIEVSFPGFSLLRYDDIRVPLNEKHAFSVQMLGELTEQVRVTATRSVVDLDKTESSTKFSDEFISDLPVLDRFYQNILVMAPGVQDADGDGNPNVHGSRARDFQTLVGGVSNVDPLTGQWLSRVNLNSIEEMEVISAGAGVEFGRAQGGFARIIQKQGSNTHEGIVEFYWQSSKLDGTGANDGSALEDPEFETYLPGFQFSGPILRDKLWYRVSYERRDREEPINILTGIEVYTREAETRDAQITWQATARNKLAFQYRSDPLVEENFGISSRVPVESSERHDRNVDTWSMTWTAPYSPKILFESTAAWQEISLRTSPSVPGQLNDCVPGSVDPFLRNALCHDLTNNLLSGSFNEDILDERERFTVKSQSTIYAGRFWGMSHQFKLGLSVENERYFRHLRRSPSITFDIVPQMGFSSPFGVIISRVDVPEADNVRATGTNWALYAEDQFKPAQNVTITLGARVDREELNSEGREKLDFVAELAAYEATVVLDQIGLVPVAELPDEAIGAWEEYFTGYETIREFESQLVAILCADLPHLEVGNCETLTEMQVLSQLQDDLRSKRQGSGINIQNTNLSPFLSVAWSPWGDGKTAVKAAVGRHYNNIPLIVPLQELEPAITAVEYRADLDTFQTQIAGGILPNITVSTVDPDLRTPYQDELTFSLERELWAESSVRVTYVKREFRDQIQDKNTNVQTGDYGKCSSFAQQVLNNSLVVPSPGLSETDTDPGLGDGQLDDCSGATIFVGGSDPFGADATRLQVPDGKADLYIVNPFWGGVFEIGNNNEIDYQAVVIEFIRRQYRSWEMNASYTWSEATGNGEDFFQELGRDPVLTPDTQGFQSYDQRHVVKLNATTITPWGIRLGTAVTWQSGLPYSVLTEALSDDPLPPSTSIFGTPGVRVRQAYPTGVRNSERNDSFWNVDLQASKDFRAGKLNIRLSAELFNALNDDTYQVYNPFLGAGQNLNGFNEAQRRFGRRWQLGVKLAF